MSSWDEVNLNSVQGVCVDESVATSTPTVNRITEPAIIINHKLGVTPSCSYKESMSYRKPASKNWAAAPSTPHAIISTTPVTLHNSTFPTTSSPIESTEATVTVSEYGGL